MPQTTALLPNTKRRSRQRVFDCWPLAFVLWPLNTWAFRQDHQTNTKAKNQRPKTQGLLPSLILCLPICQEVNEEKRDSTQKEHVDPSSFVKQEIKNGP